MAIIITRHGKQATKLSESSFAYENDLQNFIYENPDTVPLYDIDDDIRLLILAREVPTKSGSIDAVGMDGGGEVYIIETKLYKNPDKRLVVAQVLDYGASISENFNDEMEFMRIIEAKATSHFNISLNEKISSFFGLSSDDAVTLIDRFRENLSGGRFRFVVLMDHIEKRLRDLISFLNRNSNFDVFGVELEFYKYDDFEITIPKLIGAEIKKEVTSSSGSSRRKWDEISFFKELANNLEEDKLVVVTEFYNFFVENADHINWGTGIQRGSFNPIFKKIAPRSLISVYTDGTLMLNYAWMTGNEGLLQLKSKYCNLMSKILELPTEEGNLKIPAYAIEEWIDSIQLIEKLFIELMDEA